MIAWRPAAAAMDQERFEVRPLIVGHQSANQGCPPQRAALNQFAILASIGLSTRPRANRRGSFGRMIRNCDRDIPVFLITAYPDLMKREGPVCHPIVTKRKTWDHRATKLCDDAAELVI